MKRRSRSTGLIAVQAARTQQATGKLLAEIRSLIESARSQVVQTVNSTLVILYWEIGNRVHRDVLREERAEYGKQIVASLSRQLTIEYGKGFNERNLAYMIRFAEVFPTKKILHTLCAKLSWSHIRRIIYLEDDLQRTFYAEMCRVEGWSVRALENKIAGMLFERTAISKKPKKLIKQELKSLREEDKLIPDLVFRDPYFLDFLGLTDAYAEKDLEAAILREMEPSFWRSAQVSVLLLGRSASPLITRIIT